MLQTDASTEYYKKRSRQLSEIRVNINQETGEISIENDGDGIDAVIIPGMFPIQLIFGMLLTSTNYNKKKKVVGGKNGYGAKTYKHFFNAFTVESVDRIRKKLVRIDYHDNMIQG